MFSARELLRGLQAFARWYRAAAELNDRPTVRAESRVPVWWRTRVRSMSVESEHSCPAPLDFLPLAGYGDLRFSQLWVF